MTWYAVETLDDAYDATKTLLTPLDARQWFRFALVVFFVGGVWAGPSATAGGSTGGPGVVRPVGPPGGGPFGQPPGDVTLPASVEAVLPVAWALLAVGIVVGLLYAFVGSVMEFALVESLRRQRVRIREYADQHFEKAVGLFTFRVALGLLVAAPAGALVLAVVWVAGEDLFVSLGLIAVLAPILVIVGLLVALADGFTTNFVVPVMVCENVGVLAGWRRFWPVLTREWRQYGGYVLVRFVLQIAAGVVASVVGGVVGAVLLAPLRVVGFLTLPVVGGAEGLVANQVALAVAAVALLGYLTVLLAVMALVFVPIQSYLRYHALLVLGDGESDLDLIPDLRLEIRERG